jgi:hypothetical protein
MDRLWPGAIPGLGARGEVGAVLGVCDECKRDRLALTSYGGRRLCLACARGSVGWAVPELIRRGKES